MISKQTINTLLVATALAISPTILLAEGSPVGITRDMSSITIKHNGEDVEIKRNQDNSATIAPAFAKTSRPCPPFCVQPMVVSKGVETIGELELLDYLDKMSKGDKSLLVIDSRSSSESAEATIPGAINMSWVHLTPSKGATTKGITKIMIDTFGVGLKKDVDDLDIDEAVVDGDMSSVFDFTEAKTLVLFCNGMWCGQSPVTIKALIKFGYPADKIKYYRDGMQGWAILGLTTAPGAE